MLFVLQKKSTSSIKGNSDPKLVHMYKLVYIYIYIYIYYIPSPLTVHFPMKRSVRYQPILHTLYYMLHTEHAYCLSYRFLNNIVITTVIEMVEMVEILDGRLGKRSVERVRYVINNLLHLVIGKMESFHSYFVFPLAFGS